MRVITERRETAGPDGQHADVIRYGRLSRDQLRALRQLRPPLRRPDVPRLGRPPAGVPLALVGQREGLEARVMTSDVPAANPTGSGEARP